MAQGNDKVEITRVPIKKIKISRNSRMDVSPDELDGLMQSIKEVGLLQPIGLIKRGTAYEVAYGNRRFLACAKLGLSSVPAIVREEKKEFDMDMQNLTENIQRRNLGLAEIGRYITLLEKEGLSMKECAVRLGVPKRYVENCLEAFNRVPEKYRDDVEVRIAPATKGQTQAPGKISVSQMNAINSARSYGLTPKECEFFYRAAKKMGPRFNPKKMKDYVAAYRQGKSLEEAVESTRPVTLNFFVEKDEYERLQKKYVHNDKSPFSSMRALLIAILKGEVSEQVKVIG